MTTSEQSAERLVAIDDLDASQVVVVEKPPHGARPLKTFPVEVRDGAIWLVGLPTDPSRR
jgi:hypothetical protein